MTSLSRRRSAMLLTFVAAGWIAPCAPAGAAEPVTAKPAPLPGPVVLGGDDDLKDLEVERARGKNR
jgi:hypothetical protein